MINYNDILIADSRLSASLYTRSEDPSTRLLWYLSRGRDDKYTTICSEEQAGKLCVEILSSGSEQDLKYPKETTLSIQFYGFPLSLLDQIDTFDLCLSHKLDFLSIARYKIHCYGKRLFEIIEGNCLPSDHMKMLIETDTKDLRSELESIYYTRPEGEYSEYIYTKSSRYADLTDYALASLKYYEDVEIRGINPFHALSSLPLSLRNIFKLTFNIESLVNIKTALEKRCLSLEAEALVRLCLKYFKGWIPEIYEYLNINE